MDAVTIAPQSSRLDLHAPPPLVVLALGAVVAERLDPGAFSPDHVALDDHGTVDVAAALPGHRWWAPERRGPDAVDVDPDSVPAALWTLGRFLLELALGRRLETADVDAVDVPRLLALVDIEGRALPPRLVDVLAALLAPNPAQRLQSTRAAARVCRDAATRFGDVDTALRGATRRKLLRVTADLPARDILSPGELRALQQQTQLAGLDELGRSSALVPSSSTQTLPPVDDLERDLARASALAAAMQPATDGADRHDDDETLERTPVPLATLAANDDDEDGDVVALRAGLRRRTRLALASVALVVFVVVLAAAFR